MKFVHGEPLAIVASGFRPLLMLSLSFALGCSNTLAGQGSGGSGSGGSNNGTNASGSASKDFGPGGACDIAAIFAKPANNCTSAACHGEAKVGGLDLLSTGLEGRLKRAVSGSEACNGEPLIDAANIDNSLLLRRIDPMRLEQAPCATLMPPGSTTGMATDDLKCVEDWVQSIATSDPEDDPGIDGDCREAVFEEQRAESYTRKVKALLTGAPVLAAELDAVNANPSALRNLVTRWVETPAFEAKARAFFDTALQQLSTFGRASSVSQIRGSDAAAFYTPSEIAMRALQQSAGRTAWNILAHDRPFTEIASTRKWMVTTSVLAYLLAADSPNRPGKGAPEKPNHVFFSTTPPAGVPADPTPAEQARLRAWKVGPDCQLIGNTKDTPLVLSFLMGATGDCASSAVMTAADSSDWREVELVPLEEGGTQLEYWNLAALRAAKKVALKIPRVGYFTQPAFLGNWRTNVDNSFRVTTNQSLIVGLGQSFDDKDTTMPLSDEGLATEHAGPGTECYNCHKNLDPMRNFFKKAFTPDFYSALTEPVTDTPSFSFFGHQAQGNDLADFGAIIAEHPQFATAWTQKLCLFANSQGCREDDPEFIRVRDGFIASSFNFKKLVVELFSSPLVTGQAATSTQRCNDFIVSIARADHLCHELEQRLSQPGICERVGDLGKAVPSDAWMRGDEVPFQPSSSSLLYSATMEALCLKLADLIVDEPKSPVQSSNMAAALDFLVTDLVDLNASDSRHAAARADLEKHVTSAMAVTSNKTLVAKSAFTLACTSPFVASLGL